MLKELFGIMKMLKKAVRDYKDGGGLFGIMKIVKNVRDYENSKELFGIVKMIKNSSGF